jgi:hypothetical protein
MIEIVRPLEKPPFEEPHVQGLEPAGGDGAVVGRNRVPPDESAIRLVGVGPEPGRCAVEGSSAEAPAASTPPILDPESTPGRTARSSRARVGYAESMRDSLNVATLAVS